VEAEMGRIRAQGQPRKTIHETPPMSKITGAKWTEGITPQSPEFKPQWHPKKIWYIYIVEYHSAMKITCRHLDGTPHFIMLSEIR
jgi:hypothetical protein